MRRLRNRILFSLGATYAGFALPQVVAPFEPVVQATILAPGGDLKGCGVRFFGVHVLETGAGREMVDGSVNVYRSGISIVKAGSFSTSLMSPPEKLEATGDKVAWLKIGDGEPLVAEKAMMMRGDDPAYNLYGGSFDEGLSALKGFLASKTVWIAFERPGREPRIFSGKTRTSPEVASQVHECLREMSRPTSR